LIKDCCDLRFGQDKGGRPLHVLDMYLSMHGPELP